MVAHYEQYRHDDKYEIQNEVVSLFYRNLQNKLHTDREKVSAEFIQNIKDCIKTLDENGLTSTEKFVMRRSIRAQFSEYGIHPIDLFVSMDLEDLKAVRGDIFKVLDEKDTFKSYIWYNICALLWGEIVKQGEEKVELVTQNIQSVRDVVSQGVKNAIKSDKYNMEQNSPSR